MFGHTVEEVFFDSLRVADAEVKEFYLVCHFFLDHLLERP